MKAGKTDQMPIKPGEEAVVVGAGKSGLDAARLLHELGARVRLVERTADKVPAEFRIWASEAGLPRGASGMPGPEVEIRCGEHRAEDFKDAALVVPCPGVPQSAFYAFLPTPHTPVLAETELAWRCLEGENVLAVTGTSGKTTTTSLCAAMLEAGGLNVFLGGNIGTPLSEYVLARKQGRVKADVIVLELSSFQLQNCTTFHPRVAMLLNISENHLDYHADMQEYTDAKMRIFQCQQSGDAAVLGTGMDEVADRYGVKARRIMVGKGELFADMLLLGPHNKSNAEAARLACRELGVSDAVAVRAAAAFQPLEHRLERVEEKNGVLYVNDSKGTTVEALRVALNAFDRPVLLLAGGKFKGGDLEGLRAMLRDKVKAVGLFGASRAYFEKAWGGAVPMSWDETLEQAVHRLQGLAAIGDVVLLAPATSSYDQYPNYLRRGEDFKRIVREMPL